jgi:hypothetical protein
MKSCLPWLTSRAGTAISLRRKVAIIALPPRTPWPSTSSPPMISPVSWCSQAATAAAISDAHIHAVLISGQPDGRCRSAAPCLESRKMFSTLVRCRYQCSAAAALAGVDTSRLVQMKL